MSVFGLKAALSLRLVLGMKINAGMRVIPVYHKSFTRVVSFPVK